MIAFLLGLLGQCGLLFALHFESEGHFPKPLSAKEERECVILLLSLVKEHNLNILILKFFETYFMV